MTAAQDARAHARVARAAWTAGVGSGRTLGVAVRGERPHAPPPQRPHGRRRGVLSGRGRRPPRAPRRVGPPGVPRRDADRDPARPLRPRGRAGDLLHPGLGGAPTTRVHPPHRRRGPRARVPRRRPPDDHPDVPRGLSRRHPPRQGHPGAARRRRRAGLPRADLLGGGAHALGPRHPARGGLHLRRQHLPHPPRPLRHPRRAAPTARDRARPGRGAGGVPVVDPEVVRAQRARRWRRIPPSAPHGLHGHGPRRDRGRGALHGLPSPLGDRSASAALRALARCHPSELSQPRPDAPETHHAPPRRYPFDTAAAALRALALLPDDTASTAAPLPT